MISKLAINLISFGDGKIVVGITTVFLTRPKGFLVNVTRLLYELNCFQTCIHICQFLKISSKMINKGSKIAIIAKKKKKAN